MWTVFYYQLSIRLKVHILLVTVEFTFCQLIAVQVGTETNFCKHGRGRKGSFAAMSRYESESGCGWKQSLRG